MCKEQPTIVAFVHQLESRASDLESYAQTFARFCGCKEMSIPLYLIANPHERNCGGGYNGGKMTLEVPSKYDIYPTFVHELLHAFLNTKKDLLKKAAGLAKGSGVPNRDKVGKVTRAQLEEIVETKKDDLNARDIDAAVRIIEGTARSMGIEVE